MQIGMTMINVITNIIIIPIATVTIIIIMIITTKMVIIIIIIGIGKVEEILTTVEDTKIMTGIITGAMKRGGIQNRAGIA